MKNFFMKISLASAMISVILLSGCASKSSPTSRIGIVNGKYAIQTTVPNNNKGKKVNLTAGQNYSCEVQGKKKITFDLKVSEDGKNMTWYNDKVDGIIPEGYYVGKIAYKPDLGLVEITKGKQAFLATSNNSGDFMVFQNVKEREKFLKLVKAVQAGKITKLEYKKRMQKVKGFVANCTQTTNNTVTHTRYLTDHEINVYQYHQRQKRA